MQPMNTIYSIITTEARASRTIAISIVSGILAILVSWLPLKWLFVSNRLLVNAVSKPGSKFDRTVFELTYETHHLLHDLLLLISAVTAIAGLLRAKGAVFRVIWFVAGTAFWVFCLQTSRSAMFRAWLFATS